MTEYKGFLYKKMNNYFYRCVGHSKIIYLHREVYNDFYGEIPKGFVVHHKDGDKTNNHSSNLKLMKLGEHSRKHNTGRKHNEESKKKMSRMVRLSKMPKRVAPIPEPYSI